MKFTPYSEDAIAEFNSSRAPPFVPIRYTSCHRLGASTNHRNDFPIGYALDEVRKMSMKDPKKLMEGTVTFQPFKMSRTTKNPRTGKENSGKIRCTIVGWLSLLLAFICMVTVLPLFTNQRSCVLCAYLGNLMSFLCQGLKSRCLYETDVVIMLV